MRRGTEIAQVNRGEEVNKWGDSSRKTDAGRNKQRRQQSGDGEDKRWRWADKERLTQTFAFCSLCRCHPTGKSGNVKTRGENEKTKREQVKAQIQKRKTLADRIPEKEETPGEE